jgi:outer membrane immunogenic protein
MWDAADIKGDHTFDDEIFHTHVRLFGTLTGRLGFLITPAVLLYGKGGVAWVVEDHSINVGGAVFNSGDFTRTGWDAGVGLEWMFFPVGPASLSGTIWVSGITTRRSLAAAFPT